MLGWFTEQAWIDHCCSTRASIGVKQGARLASRCVDLGRQQQPHWQLLQQHIINANAQFHFQSRTLLHNVLLLRVAG